MNLPLSLSDISLWLALNAIVLLITSEVISSYAWFSENVVIDRERLRLVALGLGLAFMVTVVTRIFQPF